MRDLTKLFIKWIVFGLGPFLVLFVLTALHRSLSTALSVVTESESPYCLGKNCTRGGTLAVLLAIAGYLLVPVLIGTLAAVVFDRQRRNHYVTKQDLEQQRAAHMSKLPPERK